MAANPSDTRHALLDHIISANRLKNDAALSRFLDIKAPTICKIRSRAHANVSAEVVLRIHDATGMAIRDIRFLIKQAEAEHAATIGVISVAGEA